MTARDPRTLGSVAIKSTTAGEASNGSRWWMDFETRPEVLLIGGDQISAMSTPDLQKGFAEACAKGSAPDDIFWRNGCIHVGSSAGAVEQEDLARAAHQFMEHYYRRLTYVDSAPKS